MFTGLVESLAEIVELVEEPPGKRLIVCEAGFVESAKIGDSIAINGCCLTVVALGSDTLEFQAGSETLSRTNLGELSAGSCVNLERSVQVGDRLGGHFVTGHIDAVGSLAARNDEGDWSEFWFQMPQPLPRQVVSKGSIAVDGVSLTVVEVKGDQFSVALIPHTLNMTTLGNLQPGDPVNLETDLLAKYVEKQLAGQISHK